MSKLSNIGRQTPPAIFTIILGLFGLALAWRAGALVSVVPLAVSQMLLGAVATLFLGAALSYLIKALRRPSVLIDDMRILPGRGGVAALGVCFSALAAGFAPLSAAGAIKLMYFALFFHACLAVLVIYVLATGPKEQRNVTPIWHLSFVGFIVAAVSGTALGQFGLSQVVFCGALLMALGIWAVSLVQLIRTSPAAPLRPLLAIHLAPASLFGIVALGFPADQFPIMPVMASIFTCIAALILLALLISLRWIMESGFSPLWGAFTFPMTASAVLFLSYSAATGSLLVKIIGVVVLVAATFFVPWVAAKVIQMWLKGTLATKTNASKA
ncbi:tellurium resistance protein [Lentibacter algarum]|uniref:SLAC1 family transporter n=1 Tax=Lentibacter algarum TaxID=576131 RepID=UPI001C06745B|nr:tellurium resistance protein [Lentibacter algarum]MBU2982178.1 tellurium resistance protein [Lentibacter algarum]